MTFDWTQVKEFGICPVSSFKPQTTPKPPPKIVKKIYLGQTILSPGMIKVIMINGLKFDLKNQAMIPMMKVITESSVLQNSQNLNLVFDNGDIHFVELDGIFDDREFNILKNWITKKSEELIKIANDYDAHRRPFYHFLYDLVALVKALENVPLEYHEKLIETVNSGDKLMHNRVLAEITSSLINHHIVKIEPDLKFWRKNPDLTIDGIKADVKTILTTATNDVDSLSDFAHKISKDIIIPEIEKNQLGKGGVFFISPWSQIINSLLYIFFHQMKLEGKHNYSGVQYYSKLPSIKEGQTVLVLTDHKAFENGFLLFDTRWVNQILEDFAQQGYPMIDLYDPMSYLILNNIREGCPLGVSGIDLSLMFYVR